MGHLGHPFIGFSGFYFGLPWYLSYQQHTPQKESIDIWSVEVGGGGLFYSFHLEINGAIPNLFSRFASPEKPVLIWKPMPHSPHGECHKSRQCVVFQKTFPCAASLVDWATAQPCCQKQDAFMGWQCLSEQAV